MTVETTINRTAYLGNGSTTTFAVPFKFLEPEHLVVVLTTAGADAPQTLDDDYAVTGAGAAGGGSVVFVDAPASGARVTIYRSVPPTQTSDWVENDPDPAEVKERAFDKLTMLVQQVLDGLARSFRVKETAAGSVSTDITPVPNGVLAWNSAGTALTTSTGGLPLAVLPTPIPGQYLGWDGSGALATVPVIFPTTGDGNPLDDGGVGDGVANDAPVLQGLIDDIEAAGGGKLYLPAGTWRLASALICSDVPLAIQGAGKFATTILVDNDAGWLDYQGRVADGLSVTDLTVMAGQVDESSGTGIDAAWPAGAATSGEHFLCRNVRFIPKTGYDKTRSWFATPIKLANAGGSTLVDVESDFNGPTVDVVNTATAKGLRLAACSSKGVLLRARGGQDAVQVLGCSAESSTNALDLAATGGQGLVVQGCRFRADDVPVFADGYEGVVVQGSDIGSRNTSSYSPSVFLANCKRVAVTGNSFGDATTTEAGVHVTLASTSDFIVEGNAFAGQYTASVSLTSASKGLVAGNTARGGQNLAAVANCSDVQVRGNTAFGLSGAMVSMTGTNTGVISRENFPSGAATSVVVSGSVLDISNHPEGNIVLSAPAVVHVNEIVGGYDGMVLWITAGSLSSSTAVYFDYNPGKLEVYDYISHPVSPPLFDDSATGGTAGNIEFTRRNGIWYETTRGL